MSGPTDNSGVIDLGADDLIEPGETHIIGTRCKTTWCSAERNADVECGDFLGPYAGLQHANRVERAAARVALSDD